MGSMTATCMPSISRTDKYLKISFLARPDAVHFEDIDDDLFIVNPVNARGGNIYCVVFHLRFAKRDAQHAGAIINRVGLADKVQVIAGDESDILACHFVDEVLSGPKRKRLPANDHNAVIGDN